MTSPPAETEAPPTPAARKAVVVLGMHRSGTSALTRVISALGCDLPQHLMPADADVNATGYWESVPIMRLNDRVLSSAGSAWFDWTEVKAQWWSSSVATELQQEALRVLEEEFGASRLFVLKDPRICRLVPFWRAVLRSAGVEPLILIPLRNPLEVAASLQKRNGFPAAYSHLLWLRHVLDAEASTRGTPRLFTTYEQLMQDWRGLTAAVRAQFEVEWPEPPSKTETELEGFVSAEHRHFTVEPEAALEDPALSSWLRQSYRICTEWAAHGEREQDFALLDGIRRELHAASPAFAPLLAEAPHARKREAELASLRAQHAESERQRKESAAQSERRAASLAQSERRVAELEVSAEAQLRRLAELQALVDTQAKELAAAQERAKEQAKELAQAHEQAQARSAESRLQAERQAAQVERLQEEQLALSRVLLDAETKLGAVRQGAAEKLRRQQAEHQHRRVELVNQALKRWLFESEGLPHLLLSKEQRRKARLLESGLFEPEWYLRQNPDVAAAGMDPALHYLRYGLNEGRSPSPSVLVEAVVEDDQSQKLG